MLHKAACHPLRRGHANLYRSNFSICAAEASKDKGISENELFVLNLNIKKETTKGSIRRVL